MGLNIVVDVFIVADVVIGIVAFSVVVVLMVVESGPESIIDILGLSIDSSLKLSLSF